MTTPSTSTAPTEISDQTTFNLERWREVVDDPYYTQIEGRVETDRYGSVVMSPPPGFYHGDRQFQIAARLSEHLPDGKVITECPVSTEDGVRGIDVAWVSHRRIEDGLTENVLIIAPEICVEVVSPRNTKRELERKKTLYFEAGAEEFWLCGSEGEMAFFLKDDPETPAQSQLIPDFPGLIEVE